MDSLQSKITVANAALGKCGVASITSIDPPDANSKGAIRIALVYPQLLAYCLAQNFWTFARKTVSLATLSITPPDFGDGASIAYAYPPDWIKDYKWKFPAAIIRKESDAIYSDTASMIVKYIFQNDNPATYTPEFIEYFATYMASQICYDLTNNAVKANALLEESAGKLQQAISADSQGDTPDQAVQDEWLVARLSGSNSVQPLPGAVGFFSPGPLG